MLAERQRRRRPAHSKSDGRRSSLPRLSGPWALLAAMVVVALVGVGVAVWKVRSPKVAAPSDWAGLSDVAHTVEQARGLRFDHPVRVALVGASDLAARAEDDPADPAEGAGDPSEQATRLVRRAQALVALGVAADVDESVWGELQGASGRAAWYDASRREVVVLGTDPRSPVVRGRLLQELTRALVHQRLRAADDGGDRPEDHVGRALLAGDAVRVARDDADAGASLPPFTVDEAGLGESTVRVLLAWGGQQALDEGQRNPAPSIRALFDPLGWEERPQPAEVSSPKAEDGEKVVARGWLGPSVWLRLLAPGNVFGVAVRAAYGWSGDAYTVVRRGADTCIRVNVATDSLPDAVEFDVALAPWVAAGGGTRQVVQEAEQLSVTACTLARPPTAGPGFTAPAAPGRGATSPSAPSAGPSGPSSGSVPSAVDPSTTTTTGPGTAAPAPPGASTGASAGDEVLWAPFWVDALLTTVAAQQPRPEASIARCAAIEAVASMQLAQLADPVAPLAELQRRYGSATDGCQTRQGGGSSLPSTSR